MIARGNNKMVLNVEIISKEMVKPSSPTPLNLRNHKLSFLDQLAPPVYVPLIFFYPSDQLGCEIDHRAKNSLSLKQSLSNTLTQFYPLAGRIKDNLFVDCDDTGVEFIEAQVHSQLSKVIEKPNMEELKQYLPVEPYSSGIGMVRKILLAIQINFFECGGMAIGVCMSHQIADGSSLVSFINSWAAISRGDTKILSPNFDMAAHFPPRDLLGFRPTTGITKEKIVTRRFVFDNSQLAALKEAASSAFGSQVKDPTRVEAISAFIWRHFMEVAKVKMDTRKIFGSIHAVNLRPKMNPPLPDHAFGNLWRVALALLLPPDGAGDYHDLVTQLRNAIRKINSDYVKKLQTGDEYLEFLNRSTEQFSKGDVEFCNFSSWCRFPVYEVDYGWGKPVWVCTTTMPFKNVVILMSTRSGDGIEAWVNMVEDDMVMLEQDHKLLSANNFAA
ncbi:unnamed protein product [Ilex paraguariensis]|uniref:Vinorine synthase-like n=1 Tax=Ilex paraguariensis TaxID=185542 RepID=A0ABC8TSY8_9AQUA